MVFFLLRKRKSFLIMPDMISDLFQALIEMIWCLLLLGLKLVISLFELIVVSVEMLLSFIVLFLD
jgi:hypothetical protein